MTLGEAVFIFIGKDRDRAALLKSVIDTLGPLNCWQLRAPVLKPMEQQGLIEANSSTKIRSGTYPPGGRLRFTDPIEEQNILFLPQADTGLAYSRIRRL